MQTQPQTETTAQAQVDALRLQMVRLRAERGGLNLCANSPAEIEHAIEQTVAAWAIEAEMRFGAIPFRIKVPPGSVELGPLLVAAIGADAMRERLRKNAAALPVGTPIAEREKRIVEIEAELRTLGLEEERLISGSEQAGQRIARRWDADPAIAQQPD